MSSQECGFLIVSGVDSADQLQVINSDWLIQKYRGKKFDLTSFPGGFTRFKDFEKVTLLDQVRISANLHKISGVVVVDKVEHLPGRDINAIEPIEVIGRLIKREFKELRVDGYCLANDQFHKIFTRLPRSNQSGLLIPAQFARSY